MAFSELQKVPFDPGFSKLATGFPVEIFGHLDEIAKLKQNHQKKFAFTNLESQIVPIIKTNASFYLGCILWGSYLFWKYKDDAREIDGNHVLSLNEEERDKISYSNEVDFILEFINKFEKSAKFYLNRSSRLNSDVIKYFKTYKEFVKLNDSFKNLKFTNEIQLPDQVRHFESHNGQKLDELKQKIEEIIKSGKLENILELGFYN